MACSATIRRIDDSPSCRISVLVDDAADAVGIDGDDGNDKVDEAGIGGAWGKDDVDDDSPIPPRGNSRRVLGDIIVKLIYP